MKIIRYKYLINEINNGTEENPNIEQIFGEKIIECQTQEQYETNLTIAEKEAIPGTLDPDPDGEFEPASDELTDAERITQLEEALELLLSGVTE